MGVELQLGLFFIGIMMIHHWLSGHTMFKQTHITINHNGNIWEHSLEQRYITVLMGIFMGILMGISMVLYC